ncbi:hypothetical protein B0H12DRAFT_1246833 [Mycena haematopus]|nr:hypothetical protein B0H12DRAFT_1246833 [Mycena haematopus]
MGAPWHRAPARGARVAPAAYQFDDLNASGYDEDIKVESVPLQISAALTGAANITDLDGEEDIHPISPHPRPQDDSVAVHSRRQRRAAAPRRAGTPAHSVGSGGESSTDEYGDQQDLYKRQRDQVKSVGARLSPTVEEEDEDDFEDLQAQIEEAGMEEDSEEDEVSGSKKAKGKGKAKAKATTRSKGKAATRSNAKPMTRTKVKAKAKARGKGKAKKTAATATQGDDEDGGEEEDEDDDDETGGKNKRGPIPSEIQERAFAIQAKYFADIDALATECGKPSTALFQLLGNDIKTPRAMSAWNAWQSWYAEEHPNNGASDYTAQSRKAYEDALKFDDEFTKDMAKDSDAVYRRLPHLKEWRAQLETQAVVDLRDKGKLRRKIQQEMKPVLHIAQYFLNTYGIWLMGYVIDPDGDASHAFGVGKTYQIFKKQEGLDRRVNDLGHMLA